MIRPENGDLSAGIAQLVEHDLAKVGVASSSLVSRSRFYKTPLAGVLFFLRVDRRDDCANLVSRFVIWPGGRVVMQRTANPRTPVQFRPRPPDGNPAPAGFFLALSQAT